MLRLSLIFIMLCKLSNCLGAGQIEFEASANHIPIIKGLNDNPIIRIKVTKLDKLNSININQIICSTDPSSLNSIDKLVIFQSSKEVFENVKEVGSIKPTSSKITVPIIFSVISDIQYLWVSVQLKNNSISKYKFRMNCTAIVSESNVEQSIKQLSENYSWYIGVAVRKAGDDSVHTYRIPGIVKTKNGTLLAVYDIRYKSSRDLPGNIDVGLSRSKDNGINWEPMKVIMDMGAPHENNGVGDPAILYDSKTNRIWVAALWSKGNRSVADSKPGLSPDTTGQFVLVHSDDDGVTWSRPTSITSAIKNPIWHIFFQGPGSGIEMKNGNLVFAAQYWDENRIPYSTIVYSEDHGVSWKGKLAGPKSNTTESQVVETSDGTLLLNMRDNRGKYRSIATTNDMGQTWQEHKTSYNTLQDPICMGSLIKAKVKVKGKLRDVLFFSNPNSSSDRKNISIKASLDLGETWLEENQFLVDQRKCYGYSSLTKLDNKTVGIFYEGIRDLYFVAIPISEIIK